MRMGRLSFACYAHAQVFVNIMERYEFLWNNTAGILILFILIKISGK